MELHHLVGKLSTAETLLTEVFVCIPRSFLVINVCNRERLYAHPVYRWLLCELEYLVVGCISSVGSGRVTM